MRISNKAFRIYQREVRETKATMEYFGESKGFSRLHTTNSETITTKLISDLKAMINADRKGIKLDHDLEIISTSEHNYRMEVISHIEATVNRTENMYFGGM